MKISSGVTDQYIYFVAVDSADFTTRETGFSSFTVYRSRDGAAAAAMTTPTINETDSSNMPGVYELLLDEDMTIGSGNDTEEMAFHITHAGMAPVTRTIELYRPKITAGYTLGVESDGDLTKVDTLDGHTAQTADVADLNDLGVSDLNTACDTVTVTSIATDVITALSVKADAVTKIQDGLATPTNITAGTIATVTNLTNAPTVGSLTAAMITEVEDAVWDATATDHIAGGSSGALTINFASVLGNKSDATSAGNPTNSESVIQYLKQTVNTLEGDIGIPAMPAAAAPGNDVSVAQMVRAIYDDTNNIDTQVGTAGAGLSNLGGMSDAMKNEVNAEVDTALATTTYAEPSGVPASTDDLATKIGYVYMALRNKITVGTGYKDFCGDDEASEWRKSVADDATTYTEGEAEAPA